MTLTWRQIRAYLELYEQLDRIERASDLAITAIGTQGDQKAIDKTMRDLTS